MEAGQSTCPLCKRTWTVTVTDDCFVPACGCYGAWETAARKDNPSRPCTPCGMSHARECIYPHDARN